MDNMIDAKIKILIVDDKPENLFALEKLLTKLDVKVIQALSGAEALGLAMEHDFCVAIVDIQMPEMDGYEFVELLRSNKSTANLPIIFVSAIYSDEYHHRKGYDAGAVDFMSKPIVGEILLSKVRVFMDLYHQRKALEVSNAMLSKRAVQMETASRVSQQITSILDLNELLVEVTWAIQSRFGYFFVGIWLLNEQKDKLILQAYTCRENQIFDKRISIPLNMVQGGLLRTYQTAKACLVSDAEGKVDSLGSEKLVGPRVALIFPLKVGTQIVGLLDIRDDQMNGFGDVTQQVLEMLANQITIAISNASVYKLEKELRSIEKEKAQALAKLNEDKDKFFSIISHDLRGPFNILLGYAQLLVMNIDDLSKQEIKEIVTDVHKGAKAAYSLLENLLTWSWMQREGGMKCNPESVELMDLARQIEEVLGPLAAQKEIKLNNAMVEGVWVWADRNMLETVIRNLVGNALKFTPRGGKVTLALQDGCEDPRADIVRVMVKDTGVGMSAENQAKLFRIDVHHSTSGTEKETGSGLGLIICKEMVERNGGKIWAESELGQGTTMMFTVPRTTPPPT